MPLIAYLALFLHFRAPGLSEEQMLDLIGDYADKDVQDRIEFEDGTTLIGRGDLPEGDCMNYTYLPDGSVRYEYYDSVHEAFYTLTARSDVTEAADRDAQRALLSSSVTADNLRWERWVASIKGFFQR